ncbi:MAG TPA: ABC transporter permease [Streptosporangiaceae bacterium]|jgi:putative ABC transport system permease protein
MFFVTYLRRELRRRMRQAIFIAFGLAIGVGLVVTVTAASAGVRKAQTAVLRSLYGVGTDVTVTGAAPKPPANGGPAQSGGPGSGPSKRGQSLQIGPNGAQFCSNGKCQNAAGKTIDNLIAPYSSISGSSVAAAAQLRDVSAAAGGLTLTDTKITIPKSLGQPGGGLPTPSEVSIDGVDLAHRDLGPLSSATVTSGRDFRSADAQAAVTVVDSDYAISNKLKIGSTLKIDKVKFTIIGLVRQPQASSPPNVYIPLAKAQAMNSPAGSLKDKVNTIYVTAASAADIGTVQHEVTKLLPKTTVTTASSLASEITGSASSAAKLAGELGRWLTIGVLVAAFAFASLLTLTSVSRRVTEFGTLKALGWRSRRIIAQVLGESATAGLAGAGAGVGLGFGGVAVLSEVAPKLTAKVPTSTGAVFRQVAAGPGGVTRGSGPSAVHTIVVPLSASVSGGAIAIAVALALLGALVAGAFAAWRIGRLRPATALTKVA